MQKFLLAQQVQGHVLGRFLSGASVSIVQSESLGLEIAVNEAEESTDNRLYFTITPTRFIPANETLTFQVLRQKQSSTFDKILTHRVPAPTLISIKKRDDTEAKGMPGTDLEVKLDGTGFHHGDVELMVELPGSSDSGITIPEDLVSVEGTTVINATFRIADNAVAGDRRVRVRTSGGLTGAVVLTVEAPAPPADAGGGDSPDQPPPDEQ